MNISNSTLVQWDSIKLIHLTTEVCLYLFAFIGNLLTLIVVYRFPKLRKINNVIIISLAVSDMLVGFIGLATKTVIYHAVYLVKVFSFFFNISIYSSLIHVVVLIVDRYIAIFFPLRYVAIVNKTFLKIILPVTWLLACAVFAIPGILFTLRYNSTKDGQTYLLFLIVAEYVLYFSILISLLLMSIKILLLVRDKMKVLPGQQTSLDNQKGVNKATKRISLILLTFIITYSPGSLSLFIYLDVENHFYFIKNFIPLCTNFAILNSCANIIIYSTTSHTFRSAYVGQIKGLYECVIKPFK